MRSFISRDLRDLALACTTTLAVWIVVGRPVPASAHPDRPPRPAAAVEERSARAHDGLYLHLAGGLGYSHIDGEAEDGAGDPVALRGMGPALVMALGGALVEDVILFGELTLNGASGATVDGVTTEDVSMRAVGVGGGAALYLPRNFVVSGSLHLTQLGVAYDDEDLISTRPGPGAAAMIGKEWWVSDDWGVGLGALGRIARTIGDHPDPDFVWTSASVSLVVSATYN